MIQKPMQLKVLLMISLMSLWACQKSPGTGGDAVIKGYVHVQKWNTTFTQKIGEYPARDADVFIVYGDRNYGYDDRARTDYQGRFQFPYLYEGHYTLYVYSRDSSDTDVSGVKAVLREVDINDPREVVVTDTITIFE